MIPIPSNDSSGALAAARWRQPRTRELREFTGLPSVNSPLPPDLSLSLSLSLSLLLTRAPVICTRETYIKARAAAAATTDK